MWTQRVLVQSVMFLNLFVLAGACTSEQLVDGQICDDATGTCEAVACEGLGDTSCPEGMVCTEDAVCDELRPLVVCGSGCDGGCGAYTNKAQYEGKACISKVDRNTVKASVTFKAKIAPRDSRCRVYVETRRDRAVGSTLIEKRTFSCPSRGQTRTYAYSVNVADRGEYFTRGYMRYFVDPSATNLKDSQELGMRP